MSQEIYIYSLACPETNEIRYIGKAKNLKTRYRGHISNAKTGKEKSYKSNWIKNLLSKNLLPVMEIIDVVDESNWKFWEIYWISQFKTWGFNLTNTTIGGDGDGSHLIGNTYTLGRTLTESHKHNISDSKERKNKGAYFTRSYNCQCCGKEFLSGNINPKYCSQACMIKKRPVRKGFTLSKERRDQIRETIINNGIGFQKGNVPHMKKVIDTVTGVIYKSVKEAAEAIGMKVYTLRAMLIGRNFNKTNLIFYTS